MHPGTYTYATLLMLYTFIAPLVLFNNFLCKAFIETQKKDGRLTWGGGGREIITLDIQLKCKLSKSPNVE